MIKFSILNRLILPIARSEPSIAPKNTAIADYETIIEDVKEVFYSDVYEMAFNGRCDIDIDGYHEAMKIIAEKYSFIYERVEL